MNSQETKAVRTPTKMTLDKYGLSLPEWKAIYVGQGGVCAICGKAPSSGIFHVDHKHIPKYKTMPAQIKKMYVRGLLCQFCNRFYMARAMTKLKAENIIKYLDQFELRRMFKPQSNLAASRKSFLKTLDEVAPRKRKL
jgi:hypothetical protein